MILRGGTKGPNYSPEDVQAAAKALQKIQPEKAPSLMVDASHGNSQKDYRNQPKVSTRRRDSLFMWPAHADLELCSPFI